MSQGQASVARDSANLATLFTCILLEQVLGYLTFLLIARYLGSQVLGQFVFLYSTLGLAVLFTNQGLDPYLLREMSRTPEETTRLLANGVFLRFGLGCAAFGFCVAWLCHRWRGLSLVGAAVAGGFAHLLLVTTSTHIQLLYSRGHALRLALYRLLERSLALALSSILLLAGRGLPGIAIALLCSSAFLSALLVFSCRRYAAILTAPDLARSWNLLVQSVPFTATIAFQYIYNRLDCVMLGVLSGEAETGIYGAAYRILDAILVFSIVTNAVVYPRLSRSGSATDETFRRLIRVALSVIMLLGVPAVAGLWIVAPDLIQVLYGSEYVRGGSLLRILSPGALLLPLLLISGCALSAAGRQVWQARLMGLVAGINLGLNIALIPRSGGLGAAISTVLSMAVGSFAGLFMIRESISAKSLWQATSRSTLGTGVMVAVLELSGPHGLPAIVLLGTGVYLGTLAPMRTWSWLESL